MCYFLSAIYSRTGELYVNPLIDSHSTLIALYGLKEGKAGDAFVRLEFKPDDGKSFDDLSKYKLLVDERRIPAWFDDEARERAVARLEKTIKGIIIEDDRPVLAGGVYIFKKKPLIGQLIQARVVHAGSSTIKDAGSSTIENAGYSTIENAGSSTIENAGSSTIKDAGSSTIENAGYSTIENAGSSTIENAGSSTINYAGSSTIENAGYSTIENAGYSTIENAGYSTIENAGSSTIKDAGSSTIENAGYSTIKDAGSSTIENAGYSTIAAVKHRAGVAVKA